MAAVILGAIVATVILIVAFIAVAATLPSLDEIQQRENEK